MKLCFFFVVFAVFGEFVIDGGLGGGRIIQEKIAQNYSSSPGHGKEGAE